MSRYIYTDFSIEKNKNKIDISRLKRDYSKYPLQTTKNGINSEYLPKEDIEYLYIELNLHISEIATFCGTNGKKIERNIKKYNIRKSTKLIQTQRNHTNTKRYGGFSPMCSKNILKKSEKTIELKYGCKWFSQTTEWKTHIKNNRNNIDSKRYNTMKKNHTFKSSKQEKQIYQMLLTKFPQTKNPYHSELYPFDCDFYIPELDLYIEYQGHWTHGFEPFDKNNEKHQKILEDYSNRAKQKNFKENYKNYFLKFIEVWTIRDPLKRQTARDNNLNWIEFFNMNEFIDWFSKQ